MQASSDGRVNLEELVRKAQEGDRASVAALYEHFFDQVFRYVSFKTQSPLEAEDITGEVFVRMIEAIGSFRWQGYPFSSWLFRIAHNLVIDHFRRKGKGKTLSLEAAELDFGAPSPDLDGHLDRERAMQEVRQAIGELTDLQREVISLRFAGGLSLSETAKAIGRNENAVKALQHAALKKLRAMLNPGVADYLGPVIPRGYQEVRDEP
jgi:RNA polymerase sigma-70 factor (ECF subfamily)